MTDMTNEKILEAFKGVPLKRLRRVTANITAMVLDGFKDEELGRRIKDYGALVNRAVQLRQAGHRTTKKGGAT